MLTKSYAITSFGIDLVKVTVEVNLFSKGFPGFEIIGLPGKEISESRERIASALRSAGLSISGKKLLVNLAPADIPKEGSSYDLPIAAGIIAALLNAPLNDNILMFGEVSLDGSIVYTKKSFIALIFALSNDYEKVFVSRSNSVEMNLCSNTQVYGFCHINDLVTYIENGILPTHDGTESRLDQNTKRHCSVHQTTLDEIIGQETAKRGIEISAAGQHNVLLEGPPGSGKSMLSKSYTSLLPELDFEEALNVTKIHSIAGSINEGSGIIKQAPFRTPHHTISYAGMLGGSSVPRPGEVSLAHHGVLFMDEFPEFSRQVLESLRQPLEEGISVIIRNKGSFIFPARFTLVAASNPCPCGFLTHPSAACTCTPQQIQKYKAKMSGPILDRIDIHIPVQPVNVEKLMLRDTLKAGIHVRSKEDPVITRIANARDIQKRRYNNRNIKCNAHMTGEDIRKYCQLDSESRLLMKNAAIKLNLSARAYYKVIKVARTIADLENSDTIESSHIAESLQYRR